MADERVVVCRNQLYLSLKWICLQFDSLMSDNGWSPANRYICLLRESWYSGQKVLGTQQVTCTDTEIETLQKYFSL